MRTVTIQFTSEIGQLRRSQVRSGVPTVRHERKGGIENIETNDSVLCLRWRRPSGTALPGEVPNRPKLRRSKAEVVSVVGKGRLSACQVGAEETSESEPTDDAPKDHR